MRSVDSHEDHRPENCYAISSISRPVRASIPSMRAGTLRFRFRQELTNAGDHLRAVQLDRGHEGLMRETAHPVFQVKAGRAEHGEICRDFLGDGLWRAHVERAVRPDLTQKGFLGRDGESAGLGDAADDLAVARPERFAGLVVGPVDMTRRVHAYRKRWALEMLQRPQEQLRERREARWGSANDREHQREAQACGADDRLRAAADADPHWKRSEFRMRHHVLIVERGARLALPRDRPALDELREEAGLLLEELLVGGKVVAEERERVNAGAPSKDDLCPPAGDGVERGVTLKHAHGIVRAQDRDGRPKMDVGGTRSDRAEHHVAGRQRKVIGMVFANPVEIHADLVRKDPLLDKIPDRLRVRERAVILVMRDIAEGVEAKGEWELHGYGCSTGRYYGHVDALLLIVGLARAGAGLRCLGADRQLKLATAQRHPEDRPPRFEQAARAQAVEAHGVVPDALDELRHRVYRAWIVAGNSERAAFRRTLRSAVVVQLIVADVVEGLDDCRPHEPALDDLATAVTMILEQLLHAVDGRPVVHHIDDDYAAEQRRVQRRELVQRDRQHHQVCLRDRLGCPPRLDSRREHLDDQLDLLRVARCRDRHLIARLLRDSRDDGADVARPEYGDPW